MSNIGRQYPSEMETYTDQSTGRKITRLTKSGDNYQFYFTENSFTEGDREIIYQHSEVPLFESGMVDLFAMDLKTGIRTQLTDFATQFKQVSAFCFDKSNDSKIIIFVADKDLYRLDRESGQITQLYKTPQEFNITGLNLSYDNRYVILTLSEIPKYDREFSKTNYDGMVEAFYAIKRARIVLLDIDGSNAQIIFQDTQNINHVQFAPDSNEYVMFCHEGPWNRVGQRIWLLNTLTRTVEPCFRQKEEDSVGHEFWTRDGLICFENRGAGFDGTITVDKKQATTLMNDYEEAMPKVGFADRKGNIKRIVEIPFYCNHYHANKNNTLLVADGVHELVLIDISKDKPVVEKLCDHNTSWISHNTHCHPTWSWSNDKILFASDRDRLGYAQLYLIDVPFGLEKKSE